VATATIRCVGTAQMPATDDASSSVGSATITLPDGILDNDLFLVIAAIRSATVTPSVTTPGGQTWTAGTQLQANNLTVNYFWCRVSGAFTNPVIGWTTANSYVLWAMNFRGVDTTTAIDAAAVLTAQAAAATFTNGSSYITTATNGALVLHAMCSADNNTWGSHTAGFTLPYGRTQWRNSVTTGTSMTAAYQVQAAAGGSTSFSATEATLGNDAGIRFAVALKPATVSAEANFAQVGHLATGTGTTPVDVTTPATPKLAFFLQTRQTADGGGDGLKQGFGVLAEGQQRAIYAGAVDNVGFGDSVIAMYKNAVAVAFNPINTVGGDTDAGANHVGTAGVVASASKFTFTPTDAFAENGLISYLALGGDDIQAVAIGDFTLPLATGSVTYSAMCPFDWDFCFAPNSWRDAAAYNELTSAVDSDECVGFSLGMCDASFNQGYSIGGANSQASGATTGSSLSKTGAMYAEYDWTAEFNGTHAFRYEGVVTAKAFGSITINWTTVSGTTAAANLRSLVFVKLSASGKMKIITGNTPTSTGNLDITTDVGATSLSGTTYCGGVFTSGCSGTGGTTRATDEALTFGFFDGTNNEAAWWWYQQGGGSSGSVPTDNRSYRTSTACFAQRSVNSSSTAVGTATATSLVDKLRLNFTATDASSHLGVGFLFGPKAATAAALAGDITAPAALTGALTTGIQLGSSISDTASVVGALTTGIRLASAVSDASVVVGALTTQIPLLGSISDASSVAGALTTGIPLQGSASDASVVVGALTTQIPLLSSVSDTASVAGALVTGIPLLGSASSASVAFGNLTTGIPLSGVASDAAAVIGALTTQILLSTNVSTSSAVAGALTTGIQLGGSVSDISVASGSLTTVIQLTGNLNNAAVLNGTITGASAALAGGITNTSVVVGSLTTGIPLQGSVSDSTIVIGDLSANAQFTGGISNSASISGGLTTGIQLGGITSNVSAVVGSLTTGIPLLGSIVDASVSAGAITTGIQLLGSVTNASTLTGALITAIQLSASVSNAATVSGTVISSGSLAGDIHSPASVIADLTTGIPLQGGAQGASATTGNLTTGLQLNTSVACSASVVGSLATAIQVAGNISNLASMSGAISTGIQLSSSIISNAQIVGALAAISSSELAGAISNVAVVAGDLTTTSFIAGLITSSTVVVGDISTRILLVGAISNVSLLIADLTGGAPIRRQLSLAGDGGGRASSIASNSATYIINTNDSTIIKIK
jgi:hypothetical protein